MGLILPYPNTPANGQSLDANPVQSNINAIAQAIQSFDGSQVSAGTILAAALSSQINPNTLLHDTVSSFVQSGCTWSIVSGLQGTMTGGVVYTGPASGTFRVSVTGVGSHTFGASQDTYVDIDYNGNTYYSAVANGAASPVLTANSVRVAKIITNATAIATVVQSGYDSNFVPIYPRSAAALGGLSNSIQSYTNTGSGGGTFYYLSLGGLKLLFGTTAQMGTAYPITWSLSLPPGFFSTIYTVVSAPSNLATSVQQGVSIATSLPATGSPTGITGYLWATSSPAGTAGAVSLILLGI